MEKPRRLPEIKIIPATTFKDPLLSSQLEIRTFSKSSLADGRSAASELSPVCFSTLSPLMTVVLTTLLTFRPCTGSTSKWDDVAASRTRGCEKVS